VELLPQRQRGRLVDYFSFDNVRCVAALEDCGNHYADGNNGQNGGNQNQLH
jgi:hypothetical protein